MCSFTAAGTAYATHGVDMIPFFIFYSMFGFQRIGDLIWAVGDERGRGFLLGATAGRTTLNGEGLQHEDGHSHVLASVVPNLVAYDPAFAYELAVIVADGLRRMYREREDVFYYLTLYNENYPQPAMPEGVEEGILRGLYRLARLGARGEAARASSSSARGRSCARRCARRRSSRETYGVAADVWSVTSYKELRRDALDVRALEPAPPRRGAARALRDARARPGARARSSRSRDYMKLVPDQIARWVPQGLVPLGTDGFGRSETRDALRRFFEIDAEYVALAALAELARRGEIDRGIAARAARELGIDPETPNPIVR